MAGKTNTILLGGLAAIVWLCGLTISTTYGQTVTSLAIVQNADAAGNVRSYRLISDWNSSSVLAGGGGNGAVNRGETISFAITIANVSASEINNLTAEIESQDAYVQVLQSLASMGTVRPGREATTPNGGNYQIRILSSLPGDRNTVGLTINFLSGQYFLGSLPLEVVVEPQPPITVGKIEVIDDGHPSCNGNGIAEAGETVRILISISNENGGDIVAVANRSIEARLSFTPAAGTVSPVQAVVSSVRCPTLRSQAAATVLEFSATIGSIEHRQDAQSLLRLENAVYRGYLCNFAYPFEIAISAGPPRISSVTRLVGNIDYAAVEATQLSNNASVLVNGLETESVFDGSRLIFRIPADLGSQCNVQVATAEGLASTEIAFDLTATTQARPAPRLNEFYLAEESPQQLVIVGENFSGQTKVFINGQTAISELRMGLLLCKLPLDLDEPMIRVFARNRQSENSPEHEVDISQLALRPLRQDGQGTARPRIDDVYLESNEPFTIAVAGSGFDESSQVYLDGQAGATENHGRRLTFQLPRGQVQPTYNMIVRNANNAQSDNMQLNLTRLGRRVMFVSDFDEDVGPWSIDSRGLGQTRWHRHVVDGNDGCMRASIPNGTQYTDNAYTTLTSGPIAEDISRPELSFIHCMGGDSANDHLAVEVSSDGRNWRNVYTSDARLGTAWTPVTIDLSEFEGQAFQIRFAFSSDGSRTGPGLFVDNIMVQTAAVKFVSLLRDDENDRLVLTATDIDERTRLLINGYPVPAELEGQQLAFEVPGSLAGRAFRIRLQNPAGPMSRQWTIDVDELRSTRQGGVLWEGFDFGLGDWQVDTVDMTVWHDEQDEAFWGSGCARASVPQAGQYTNLADTSLISPAIDLSQLNTARLSFQRSLLCGANDVLSADVSDDNGRQWRNIYRSGHNDSPQWQGVNVDLGEHRTENILLRFRFQSDGQETGQGVFIDNVLVSSYPPEITEIFSLINSPGKAAIVGENFDWDAKVFANGSQIAARLVGNMLIYRTGDTAEDGLYRLWVENVDGIRSREMEIDNSQLQRRNSLNLQ